MPPATAASKRNGALGPPGDGLELRAVVGDDVLVRRDDRLAGPERGGDERARRLVAAHDLDDDVDRRGRPRGGPARRSGARPGCRPSRARSRSRTATPTSSSGGRRRAWRRSGALEQRPRRPRRRRCRRRARRRASGGAAHRRSPRDGSRRRIATVAGRRRRPGRRAIGGPLHSATMTTELLPAPAPARRRGRPAADLLRDPAVGDRPPRQRPGRDPQLRQAPVGVRGDLLHRRLPRADEPPRPGSCSGADARDGRRRCSPSASTRSAARCSSRATGPSTPSSPGCS